MSETSSAWAESQGSFKFKSVGLLTGAERHKLTRETVDQYEKELHQLLIPASWRRKSSQTGSLVESFYHAFHGLWIGLKHERNLRIHLSIALAVILAATLLRINTVGWLALLFSIFLVITVELINTALEHLVDLSTSGEYQLSARYAKDTAAAAVLVTSLLAVIIGAFVFVPHLTAFFSR